MSKNNKLIRDKIPELIKSGGMIPVIRILSNGELYHELFNKLLEETNEVIESKNDFKHTLKELADDYEVILQLCKYMGYSIEDLINQADAKRKVLGSFDKAIYLLDMKHAPDGPF